MFFTDRLTIDRKHRSADGYMRVHAKAARSGLQDYLGREVDPEGKHFAADQVVKVYRPPEEVFDKASIASFIGKPITDDHPSVAVTAANWRDHSRGVIGGAAKDGEWLGFDLALMDAATIAKVDDGKCELSGGYACELSIEDGTTPSGEAYQAVQRNIRGNHVAIVDQARAGPDAKIHDGGKPPFATCDSAAIILSTVQDQEPNKMHTLTIDGLKVPNVSDEAKAAIEKLQGQVTSLTTAKDTAETSVATLTTEKAALDAKVVTLEQELKDAKPTPAQLRDAGKSYAAVCDKAKALGVTVSDEMDEPAIMKAAVSAKLGDAAKDWTDVQVAASFATLTAGANTTDNRVTPIVPVQVADASAVRDLARNMQFA